MSEAKVPTSFPGEAKGAPEEGRDPEAAGLAATTAPGEGGAGGAAEAAGDGGAGGDAGAVASAGAAGAAEAAGAAGAIARAELAEPARADEFPADDVLRRAAQAIRADPKLSALVPLTLAERERLVDAAFAQALDVASRAPLPAPPAATVATVTSLAQHPRRRALRHGLTVAAGAVALAAAAALVLSRGRPTVPSLPAFALKVDGEKRSRGDVADEGPAELRPGTRLRVTLRAERPARDALVRLLLVRQGHAAVLEAPVTWEPSGTFTIDAETGALLGPQSDGAAELVVVLGRQLPDDAALRALVLAAPRSVPAHLQILRQPVVLAGFSHGAVEILLGGCRHVVSASPRGPPRCEVTAATTLRVWVGVPSPGALTVHVNGLRLSDAGEARAGGWSFSVAAPQQAGTLRVSAGGRELASWELASAPVFASIAAADQALGERDAHKASAALASVTARSSAQEQLEALRRRAKIARLLGEPANERTWRERAVELAQSLGHVSAQADETVAILYGLLAEHAIPQAVQRARALEEPARWYAEGAVRRELVRGLLFAELGDLGTALGSMQRAVELAERIGDTQDRDRTQGPLGDVLQALGRSEEAVTAIEAELARGQGAVDVCERIDALTTAGWLLRELDRPRARRLAEQAATLAEQRCARLVPMALLNQAWVLAASGQHARARALADRLAAAPQAHDSRVVTWALRLEAELVLAEAPAQAERHARELARRAERLCSTELQYEADLLRARALAALQRPEEAAAAFAAAERALGVWSHLVPLGEGRAAFFERHEQLARAALPFFLQRAQRQERGASQALAVTTRRSIARFVTSLAAGGRARAAAEQGQWGDQTFAKFERTLSRWPGGADAQAAEHGPVAGVCELRAAAMQRPAPTLELPPRHAALLVHPLPASVLILSWQGDSLRFVELAERAPGERWESFGERVAQAAAPLLHSPARVLLHLHHSLATLPLDRSLSRLLGASVGFAVDAAPVVAAAPCVGARRAVLVTNPQQNLWAASANGPLLQRRLRALGYRVDVLDGAAATRAAVVERLTDPCTALLHYDGHGQAAARAPIVGGLRGSVATGSRDRAADALLLAGGELLTAAEVLELARVPQAVILNGCTTAAPEGLGLAQAFVLAGAEQVAASLEDIPADAAAAVSQHLFEGARLPDTALDLVEAFTSVMNGQDAPWLRVFSR